MKLITSQKVFVLLTLALFGALLGAYGLIPTGNFPVAATTQWQAVFLNNNQTYFGKLENYNYGYVKLTNVYYLRAGENLQQGGDVKADNLSLVKLGGELHGPEDVMYIRKDSILFWENMKETSRVVGLIRSAR